MDTALPVQDPAPLAPLLPVQDPSDPAPLAPLSRDALIALCKENGIKGYSGKKKEELTHLLEGTQVATQGPLKPLVKWSGGKGDEIKQFEKYIPVFDTYLEPFVGGGSVFFHLSPKKAVISDVHTELIDLYQSIGQGRSTEIYDFMRDHPNDEATYYQVRDGFEVVTPLDRAKRFYYQRKTCFRGMLRYNRDGKFNIPFGRYKTIGFEDLKNPGYPLLLGRTTILNTSFETIFRDYNDERNFMFLDPPYDSEFTDYGYCQFTRVEQEALAKCFKETKIKCLMVIGKTPFIEALYQGYIVEEYAKQYRFKLYAGRVGDEINTMHLVIKNY